MVLLVPRADEAVGRLPYGPADRLDPDEVDDAVDRLRQEAPAPGQGLDGEDNPVGLRPGDGPGVAVALLHQDDLTFVVGLPVDLDDDLTIAAGTPRASGDEVEPGDGGAGDRAHAVGPLDGAGQGGAGAGAGRVSVALAPVTGRHPRCALHSHAVTTDEQRRLPPMRSEV